MAVFLINICKFNGCGITFPSLGDLIQHIEDTHIDYDPKVVEQKEQAQPACLPLSYVLRFISDAARKENPFLGSAAAAVELKRKLAIKHHSYSMSSSNRSNTPTGSEMDEDEMVVSESEDSNDSWTTEEFSSEFIMRYGSRHSGSGNNGIPGNEKPFACPVPGCKKRYKNVNGIKYHSKNGHKKDGKVRKGYKCHCGKSYKTAQGLKSHALVTHNASPESVLSSQHIASVSSATSGICSMQRSSSPSQSLGSMSPSSISNMSSSNGSCQGGNNTNINNSNCASNSLQNLATVNGTTNCMTTVANGSHCKQQQQISAASNSNTNPQQLVASSSESSFLPHNGNIVFSNSSSTSTTMTTTTPTPPAPPPPLITVSNLQSSNQSSTKHHLLNNNNNNNNNNNFHQSSPISPTFIEHKYSANIFKEKFMASLRNTSSNNSGNNAKVNSNDNNNNNNKCKTASTGSVVAEAGLAAGGGVGGLCSIQQQLNENYKNNLFKKTIN